MSVQTVERVVQEVTTFIDSNQQLSPSIVLVTTGSSEVRQCIGNAFRAASSTGYRLVIVLYPNDELAGLLQTGHSAPLNNSQAILDELAQAARDQGIREVKTFQQECWGEDELDELAKLENSKCMFLAV